MGAPETVPSDPTPAEGTPVSIRGRYVKALVPNHDEPQVCVVIRRFTVDGTYHLRDQAGQDYFGIPRADIEVPDA